MPLIQQNDVTHTKQNSYRQNLITVRTVYVVTELVNLTEGVSPGTETNIELNCLIIFVLEGFFRIPRLRGRGRNNDMKGLEIHDYIAL